MKLLGFITLLFVTHAVAGAQTVISAVTDAASYAPRVAPGGLATIFGSNLADSTQSAGGFPLPLSMAGASVYINNAQVPLLYVSETQINFQVPSSLAAGTTGMYVTRDGGQSGLFNFTVVTNSPGLFQDTSNHAIAQNPNYSTNSSTNPIASGAVLVAYLTGQGAVNNPVTDGTAAPDSPLASATATATATIGGTNATVQFLGLTPGFTGLAQANILIPAGLATADYPLVITVGGYVSASAEVSISGSGTAPPTYLTLESQLNFANGVTNSVAVYGNTTYLCGPNQVNIVDTSDVSDMSYVAYFGNDQLLGSGGKCAINPNTSEPILVDIVGPNSASDAWTLAVYSLSVPESPVLLAQLSAAPYTFLNDISFLGTEGYISTSWFQTSGNAITAQYGNFVVFEFSSLFPELLSVLSSGYGSSGDNLMPNSVALVASTNNSYPNTAYITTTTATGTSTTGSAALDVVNISSPSSMVGVAQVDVSTASIFVGFGYDGNLLLLAGNTTSVTNPNFTITGNLTLSTMNINTVEAPQGIANMTTQIPTSGTYVVQPLIIPGEVFAIVNNPPSTDPTGPSSLWIVNASTPSSPVLYPFITQFGMSDIAAAIVNSTTGYLLVPNVNGLAIYSIQAP
jgi:uncharacterized protein (TIGR03437 family)